MNCKKIAFSVVSISSAMLLSSCQCFYVSEELAPVGPIVEAMPTAKSYPPAAALNHMSTGLTAASMNSFRPGQTVPCRYDFASCNQEFNQYPERALDSIRDLITFRAAPNAAVVLYSRIVPGETARFYRWEMRMDIAGKSIWRDQVIIEAKTFSSSAVATPSEPTVIPPVIPEPTVIPPSAAGRKSFVPTVPKF